MKFDLMKRIDIVTFPKFHRQSDISPEPSPTEKRNTNILPSRQPAAKLIPKHIKKMRQNETKRRNGEKRMCWTGEKES